MTHLLIGSNWFPGLELSQTAAGIHPAVNGCIDLIDPMKTKGCGMRGQIKINVEPFPVSLTHLLIGTNWFPDLELSHPAGGCGRKVYIDHTSVDHTSVDHTSVDHTSL